MPLSKQQKLLVHDGQNSKVLLIDNKADKGAEIFANCYKTGYSNWLTQETVKYVLHM